MIESLQLAVRPRPGNPDHHLWNNNGTWWCHFTVHLPDFKKHRVRLSLDTDRIESARELRDALLALFGAPVCPRTKGASDADARDPRIPAGCAA